MEESKRIPFEKFKRSKVVIFIRKNLILIVIFLTTLLLQLLGFWDIRKYEIVEIENKDINSEIVLRLESYVEENILGENFFVFAPQKRCGEIREDFPYVESVRIEKVFPNKIVMKIKVYDESYISQLKSNRCYITSDQGVVLNEVCIDQETNCCKDYSSGELPFISSSSSEPSYISKDVQKFLLVSDLDKLRKVVETYGYEVSDIVVDGEVVDLSDTEGRVSRFNIATDLETQMSRYLVVVAKALSEGIEYSFVDLRFERPVMKL